MSRIGKLPVTVPAGVNVQVQGQTVTVSGKAGKKTVTVPPVVGVELKDGRVVLTPRAETKRARALWGTNRALINGMMTGAAKGFSVDLEIEGVGFRAAVEGKSLNLQLGYSHDVKFPIPEGIAIKVGEKQTTINVSGSDRQAVGQVAAVIRGFRPPEPYKGKGIRYAGEKILRKEGKKK